ncbi:polyphosphate--glucose phosphotransferase [Pontibacter sp. G13]|uniref:polyphosphate--glucose phosphotransferase n=1 Tax=Pontibacter sp. G13 TaxID=3074898 RepID=UPI00288A680E|nr:ROK family protein [Pontibacter sp. G13]WNJ18957.1 ROK family protein [Pontibacter sp. G13]
MEILGIDIGGSGIKGAIIDIESGELKTERLRIDTPQPATPKAVTETVGELVKQMEWSGPIGCGFPAVIQHGVAQTASNIDKDWIGTNAEKLFSKETGCPVKVVNDADAAGLAEVKYGGGAGKDGMILLLTIGTGIGSALIVDGRLVPNTELGHLIFKGDIAEKYCSDAARKREDLSWHEWGDRFDKYLNHVYRLFYPDFIILGGGASKKMAKFEDRLDVPCDVVPAELLNNAGIVGAAAAAGELVSI